MVFSLAVLTTMVLPLPPAATVFDGGKPLVNVRMVGADSNGVNVIDWGDNDDSLGAATLTMFAIRFFQKRFCLFQFRWRILSTICDGTISTEQSDYHIFPRIEIFLFSDFQPEKQDNFWLSLFRLSLSPSSLRCECRTLCVNWFFLFPVSFTGVSQFFSFAPRYYSVVCSHDKPINR